MNWKKNKVICILVVLTLFTISLLINKDIVLTSTIGNIKYKYIKDKSKKLQNEKQYGKNIIAIDGNNSDAYFIKGYIAYENKNFKESDKYFNLAFENINKNTDKFVKYYLYNKEALELIKNKKIKKAKVYTEKALENIDLNKDNNGYVLVLNCLQPYSLIEGEKSFIANNLEKYMDTNNNINSYQLKKHIAPIYYLIGQRDKAIETYMEVIYNSQLNSKTYDEVRALVDIGAIFIDIEAYDVSLDILHNALEQSYNIKDENQKNIMQMYTYTNLARCYLVNLDTKRIQIYVDKIYQMQKSVKKEDYNEFLIVAKFYESIDLVANGNLQKAKNVLDEASVILKEDEKKLIADKDIMLDVGYANIQKAKGNYLNAIKIYEDAKRKLINDGSIDFKGIILDELMKLYILTDDVKKYSKVNRELKEFDYNVKDDIANSYISNSISKFKNTEILKSNYRARLQLIIAFFIVSITFLVLYIKIRTLKKENITDGLTESYNRRYFNDVYKKLLKYKVKFSIIMFDIDDFKKINDTYGHEFGDTVLINICGAINDKLGRKIKLYRYGGEEFIVISRNKEPKEVLKKAEIIRTTVQNLTWDKDVKVTISIGVSDSVKEKENTLNMADYNLYKSKNTGKNKITY